MAGRMTSLTVITKDDEEAKHTFEMLSQIGVELSMTHHYASVSSVDPDSIEPDEPVCEIEEHEHLFYDENTLTKVDKVLREYGVSREKIEGIVASLQNHGILFRERVPGSVDHASS